MFQPEKLQIGKLFSFVYSDALRSFLSNTFLFTPLLYLGIHEMEERKGLHRQNGKYNNSCNATSSKTQGCRLWKHLLWIICQKGHTQQVIIPWQYVVIICNLHCTAVGMFVSPIKKAPFLPLPYPHAPLWHLITMHLYVFEKWWAHMLHTNGMGNHWQARRSLSEKSLIALWVTFCCFIVYDRRLSRTHNELLNGVQIYMKCCQSSVFKLIKEAPWYPALLHNKWQMEP